MALDAAEVAAGSTLRPDREACRAIATSQPFASGTLAAKPVAWETRVDSAEYVWSLQRRVGLYVTAALPTFTELREQLGIVYDPLGDTLVHAKETDKSAPHHAGVRMLYKMAQSTATHTVVMGDKERADVYKDFNEGCTVDVGEMGAGPGRRDVCVEVKAYSDVAPSTTDSHGATHGFGNVEHGLLVANKGVEARGGDHAWDVATGKGAVAAKKGVYDDALNVKRNAVVLFLINHFGGVGAEGVAWVYALKERAKAHDTTVYVLGGPTRKQWVVHWMHRLSIAVTCADARRCIRRLPGLRAKARAAARARPRQRA